MTTPSSAESPRSRAMAHGLRLAGLTAFLAFSGIASTQRSPGQEVAAAQVSTRPPTRLVEINVENRPLKEVIKDLMRQADADYVFDPSASEQLAQPFSIKIKDVSVDFALRRLLAASPITFVVGGTLASEPGAAAKIRLTYTFYHIAACRPKLPPLLIYEPPESQLAAATELFARVMADLARADLPTLEMETLSLEYIEPEQAIELLQPLTSWSSTGPAPRRRPLYALGVLAEQFTEDGAARIQRMEEEIGQKEQRLREITRNAGPDSPQAVGLVAELDKLRADYAAMEGEIANQVASIMRRIVPGGPLPVHLAAAGENRLLVMGAPEAIDRTKRAIAVIDQLPPQAEWEAYADVTLIGGKTPYRFNLSARGSGPVGKTTPITGRESSSTGTSTLAVKVTPRAATRDTVVVDTTWDLSALLKGRPLPVPVEIKQNLEALRVAVPSGKRVVVGSWSLTGRPDLSGTLTFSIAARSGAQPRLVAPTAGPPAPPSPPPTQQ